MELNMHAGAVGPDGTPAVPIAVEDIGYLADSLLRMELLLVELRNMLFKPEIAEPAWLSVTMLSKMKAEWSRVTQTIERNAEESASAAAIEMITNMVKDIDNGGGDETN